MNTTGKVLAILFAAVMFPSLAAAGQTLVYSDHEPLDNMRTRFIKDVFFAAIEEESDGRLKIEDHWGGELSRSYDALGKVGKDGTMDITVVVPEYTAADLPLHQIFKSFPVGPYGGEQVDFFRRVGAEIPEFRQELEKENVVSILFATGFPVAFFSAKPLNTLDDIQGGKWRSASFWHHDFLKNGGAEPVTMPWGDGIAKALQAGTLDGLMVNVDSGFDIKAYEVAPHVLLSKDLWLGHLYIVAMNKDTWEGLAEEDKAAIRRAALTAYGTLGKAMDDCFDDTIERMKKDGITFRVLQPKEVEQWKDITRYREMQAIWVKAQEGKGAKDAGDVLERVSAIYEEVMEK